jgi:hypothetical protein
MPSQEDQRASMAADVSRTGRDNWLYRLVFAVFWLSCLSFPFAFVPAKLVVGTALLIISWMRGVRPLSRYDALAAAAIFLSSIYLIVPYAAGKIGEFELSYLFPLHVAFPMFWWSLLRNYQARDLNMLCSITFVSVWISLAYSMGLLAESAGMLPFDMPHIYNLENTDLEMLRVASNSVSALLFSAPLASIILLHRRSLVSVTMLLAMTIGVMATGRRSILLGIAIAVILDQLFAVFGSKRRFTSLMAFFGLTTLILTIYTFDLFSMQSMLSARFQTTTFADETERVDQAYALWEGFLGHPIFGNGLGSVAAIVRSDANPWRYELSYVAALFRFGMIGCSLFFVIYVLPLASLFKSYSSFDVKVKALIVSVVGVYFTYAFNPVLDAFDSAWICLLPFAMASLIDENAVRQKRRDQTEHPAQVSMSSKYKRKGQ